MYGHRQQTETRHTSVTCINVLFIMFLCCSFEFRSKVYNWNGILGWTLARASSCSLPCSNPGTSFTRNENQYTKLT